jgi:16S rRNA (cytosine1402-N4)-methyltransferase
MQIIEKDLKKWQKDYFSQESVSFPMNKENLHYPVMWREVLQFLNPGNKKVIVDCTVGLGGHALKILPRLKGESLYIGIDKDNDSLHIAQSRLKDFQDKLVLLNDDFRNIDKILQGLNVGEVDAFLFDLGLSRYQLDNADRGFSFLREGPLDMRMDKSSFLCAYDLVNNLSEKELSLIFEKFGEERYSRRIARLLVQERRKNPFFSTGQLKDVVLRAIPARNVRQRIHPATRVFQALRIAVNRELDCLSEGLEKAVEYLSARGRIVVVSFHSLEDRIVKRVFRRHSHARILKVLTKKPLIPGANELKENISSRSAKLRAVERFL